MTASLFISGIILLSLANGANDNFKGMATLWGSDVLSYRSALILANIATFAGGVMAMVLGASLIATFSGKGIVGPDVLQNPIFVTAFACGAALTVILATALHYPISTTHSIVGALAGAAYAIPMASPAFGVLYSKAVIPLLFSPLIAMTLTFLLCQIHSLFSEKIAVVTHNLNGGGSTVNVPMKYLRSGNFEDRAHIASGMTVCFARGVNDTPKIASIMLLGNGLDLSPATIFISIAAFMVIGSWFFSANVATVMSKKITGMTPGQGLTGNFVTAILVLFASKLGLGVSTTHVSVGSLFGVGAVSGEARWRKIGEIILAWILTLPIGFLLAFLIVKFLHS